MKLILSLFMLMLIGCSTTPKIITKTIRVVEPTNASKQAKEVERCMNRLIDKNVKSGNSYDVCDKIYRVYRD